MDVVDRGQGLAIGLKQKSFVTEPKTATKAEVITEDQNSGMQLGLGGPLFRAKVALYGGGNGAPCPMSSLFNYISQHVN